MQLRYAQGSWSYTLRVGACSSSGCAEIRAKGELTFSNPQRHICCSRIDVKTMLLRRTTLPPECKCPRPLNDPAPPRIADVGTRRRSDKHIERPLSFVPHGIAHDDWQTKKPRVLRKMDALSKADSRVYVVALSKLLIQLRAVEQEFNTTILCPERLKMLRQRNAYLPGLWERASQHSSRTQAGA